MDKSVEQLKTNDFFDDIPMEKLPIDDLCSEYSSEELFFELTEKQHEKKIIQYPQLEKLENFQIFLNKILEKEDIKLPDKEIQSVFLHVDPSKSQKKNTNFVKFIIKLFFKYYRNPKYLHQDHKYVQCMEKMKSIIDQGSSKYRKLSHLSLIFGEKHSQNEYQIKNRKIMYEILGDEEVVQAEILASPYIKNKQNKKQHLIALKVYRQRSICVTLMNRVQTK